MTELRPTRRAAFWYRQEFGKYPTFRTDNIVTLPHLLLSFLLPPYRATRPLPLSTERRNRMQPWSRPLQNSDDGLGKLQGLPSRQIE